MIELSMQREIERLQRVRRRLNNESERIMREYAWLRAEGVRLHSSLKHQTTLTEPQWIELSQQFLQAHRILEQQSDAFQAACEQYIQDTQRLEYTMGRQPDRVLTLDFAL